MVKRYAFGGIPLDKMPLLKTTFKIKTLNQRGVVRYLFLLTHSVVASTSDSGSDNGGSSPPGSTWQFG